MRMRNCTKPRIVAEIKSDTEYVNIFDLLQSNSAAGDIHVGVYVYSTIHGISLDGSEGEPRTLWS